MAGFLDGRGPYAGPTKVFADSEEEARKAIENYARLGYVQIKIYSSIKPELVPAITRMAHAKHLRVSGHVPAFMTAEQFVEDGADEIQHVNFLFLNFLFDTVKDTRTPARFTAVAENAAKFDFESKRFKDFVALLKAHHTVSDPTVAIFEDMFLGRPTTIAPSLEPVASGFPLRSAGGCSTPGCPCRKARTRSTGTPPGRCSGWSASCTGPGFRSWRAPIRFRGSRSIASSSSTSKREFPRRRFCSSRPSARPA